MPLLTKEIKEFIARHGDRSPEELAFMAGKFPELPMAFIAQQVKGRQKVRKKLPSWAEHPEAVFPKSVSLEQCTSERVARYRAGELPGGGNAFDMTGGFGVDGRFLAEIYDRYYHCERDSELSEISAENFTAFGLSNRVRCIVGDGVDALRQFEDPLDLIFVDPARRDERSFKVSALESCEPDLVPLWAGLLRRAKQVAVKLSPGLDLSELLNALTGITDVYVISVENECKELFALAQADFEDDACIHCVNIGRTGEVERLDFRLQEERDLEGEFGEPLKYLYEPNASIMKAGAFKTVSSKWGVKALNPRTRLYGSEKLIEGFPGRTFEILDQAAIGPKEAKRLFPKRKANVISRNSGMSAVELRQKLKLKEGGELFAIAGAVTDVGRRLYACKLVNTAGA